MTRKQKLLLADIYARIPEVSCKGLCKESCGPIAMSKYEDRRLQERGVTIPSMVEAVAEIQNGAEYYCPALQDGRCLVYEDRPTICRLWGATASMPCPHGCTPAEALSQQESFDLLTLAGRAGGGMASRFFDPPSTGSTHDDQVERRHHGGRRRFLPGFRRDGRDRVD
jgi:hypothetical protein